MAFTRIGGSGINYPPVFWTDSSVSHSNNAINATGEAFHMTGFVVIDGADVGPKTLSSAGGKVVFLQGTTATLSDAGTTIRVGIQDPDVTSRPVHGDGTFDVSDDLIGGTDSLTTNVINEITMTSGTKDLSQGDLITIAVEMISRGGSDSVSVKSDNSTVADDSSPVLPGCWLDDGTPAAALGRPVAAIEFDDGTLGWLCEASIIEPSILTSFNVNTGTADEYGNLITPDMDLKVFGANMRCTIGGDVEVVLYSDPLGTPVVMEAFSVDATGLINTSTSFSVAFAAEHTLLKGQTYGITLRPTTTTNVSLTKWRTGLAGKYWPVQGMTKDTWHAIRRLDNTGAFSTFSSVSTDKDNRMSIALKVSAVGVRSGSASFNLGL